MKKLATWLLVGTMLGGSAAPAFAEPISTAIVTSLGLGALGITAANVTTFLVSTTLSLGLSFLSAALTKKPQPVSGVSSEVKFGGAVPREVPFGTVKTAGQLVYFKGEGKSNKTLWLVYALADWECDGLNKIYVNGDERTLTPLSVVGSEHDRYEVLDSNGTFIVKFFRGTMTQAADTELTAAALDTDGKGLGPWTSDHRGAGVCYVILRLQYGDERFPGGIPAVEYELRGARLYDRRLDSTNGGSGAHRFNDPTTWAFAENPVLMDECFRRGFTRNGVRILGMGQPNGDLIGSYYVAAANACDEALTEGGNPEKRFICSAIISDDAEYRVAIDAFVQSMAGQLVESQGLFAPIAGVAQSSAGTFNETDQLVGFAAEFSAKRSRTEKVNTIVGTFIDPAKKWEPDSFATVTDAAWLTADNNEPLQRELQLHMVRKKYQANRIAQIIAKRSRFEASHTGVYGPDYAKYAAGDWVSLVHKRGTFTMQIERRKQVGPLQFEFTLRQCAASAMGGAGSAPPIVVITDPPPPVQTVALAGFSVTAVSIAIAAFGQIRPGIRVAWTPPDDPGVAGVEIQYRVQGSTDVQTVLVQDASAGLVTLQADIMASTTYEVRARPLREPPIPTTWTAWVAVKTTDAYTVLTSGLALETQRIFAQLFESTRGNGMASQAAMLLEYADQLRQGARFNRVVSEVAATSDRGFAAVKVVTDAIVTDTAALASQVTTLQAEFDDQVASINFTLQTLADEDEALATAVLAAQARADSGTAEGLWRITTSSAPGGVTARFEAGVRVTIGDSYVFAGMFIDIVGGLGRIGFQADKFFIVTGAGASAFVPFVVSGTDVKVNALYVNQFIASFGYTEDSDGVPLIGFKDFDDGRRKGRQSTFSDMFAYGLELAHGYWQNEIPNNEAPIQFTCAAGDTVQIDSGTITRTPRAVEYSLTRNSPLFVFNLNAPISPGERWGALTIWMAKNDNGGGAGVGRTYSLEFTRTGIANKVVRDYNGARVSTTLIRNLLEADELSPLFRVAPASGTKNRFRFDSTYNKLPRVVRAPDTAVGIRVWLWGAGGWYAAAANSPQTHSDGGPGGYVKFDHAISGGEYFTLVVGESLAEFNVGGNGVGYGGTSYWHAASVTLPHTRLGGGGSFIARGKIFSRAKLLGVAGGGGAKGPGGAAASGGNGSSDTNIWRLQGLQNIEIIDVAPAATQGGGGGGYEGGGVLSAGSFAGYGKGGTNFIIGTATSTTNSSSAVDGDGAATGNTPPGTGESAYEGTWGRSQTHGLIVIEWLY